MLIETSGVVGVRPSQAPESAAQLASKLIPTTCPACGDHVAAPFYFPGKQPLAAIGWPETTEEALAMPRLPHDFVRCIVCGHVFNTSFDYTQVPYSKVPNRMFNRGDHWSRFLENVGTRILGRIPAAPVIIEVGYGDGSFLSALSRRCPQGRFIGFDPFGAPAPEGEPLELRRELFQPGLHLAELRPDLLLMRNVLEHLGDPLAFLQHAGAAAASLDHHPLMYLEVPCIDRTLETGRTQDFFYEHNSHFTTVSFRSMLDRSAVRTESLGHEYGGEVIYAFVRLDAGSQLHEYGLGALRFLEQAEQSRRKITAQLNSLHQSGKRTAIWGGTGKGAAFMNTHGVDAERFPIVVDSDATKAGTYAPGTGQLIRARDWLLTNTVDVIVIPGQWRAADIVREIHEHGIHYETILIDHHGLVDFHSDGHPYRQIDEDATGDLSALANAVMPADGVPSETRR